MGKRIGVRGKGKTLCFNKGFSPFPGTHPLLFTPNTRSGEGAGGAGPGDIEAAAWSGDIEEFSGEEEVFDESAFEGIWVDIFE